MKFKKPDTLAPFSSLFDWQPSWNSADSCTTLASWGKIKISEWISPSELQFLIIYLLYVRISISPSIMETT